MGIDILRRLYAFTLGQISAGSINKFFRNHMIADNFFISVDIIDKAVQRHDPLLQSFLQILEFLMTDDARDRIKRKQLFLEGSVFIDPEFDSVSGK